MRYLVIIAESAAEEFGRLDARWRSAIKAAMEKHLEFGPKRVSKSAIKRLRDLKSPQYRLRVGPMRVFYDVNDGQERVEVLGFVRKSEAGPWLEEHGALE